jgi:hypothetical protein
MELVITATISAAEDPDDRAYNPMIDFSGSLATGARVFEFCPEMGASPAAWRALAEACRTGVDEEVDWGPANGEARVAVDAHGLVEFEAAKYGDGAGGGLKMWARAADCAGAFDRAADLTEAWLRGE